MSHPPSDKEDCNEIIAWEFFESYIKKVAKNRASNLRRGLFREIKRESALLYEQQPTVNVDQYPSDQNRLTIKGKTYFVQDDRVYCGLLLLSEKHLEALVLHFWESWTDKQIAAHCNIVERTVRKWRKSSLEIIRQAVSCSSQDKHMTE